jgi:AraC family transcriptional activator of mtrCDE
MSVAERAGFAVDRSGTFLRGTTVMQVNEGQRKVSGPASRIPAPELDRLLSTLEVNFVKLTECLVSPGWRLSFRPEELPAVHYTIQGRGRFGIGETFSVDLEPHSLVIVPPGRAFQIDSMVEHRPVATLEYDPLKWPLVPPGEVRRIIAGEDEPRMLVICGYFRASYGTSLNLFSPHGAPIFEKFDSRDQLDQKLRTALDELVMQEIGAGAMTASLLKQVLIAVFRRSMSSMDLWIERFSALRDVHVARALAEMVARPGAPHTLQSLAELSGLSRSGFVERFTTVLGRAPMAVLRELRLRHAAHLLNVDGVSVEQAANAAGYQSRSSFIRAFRKAHGCDPSEYRKTGDVAARSHPAPER